MVSKRQRGWESLEEKYLGFLKDRLTEKTRRHSLGVGRMARELALGQGQSGEKALAAGILHDYAREMEDDALLREARRFRIPVDPVMEVQPILLHGPVGAELIREELGLTDPDILAAIRFHTCGGEGMATLSRIIYAADILEPSRDFPGVEGLRRQIRDDFPSGLVMVVESTINYVLSQQYLLHPSTVDFWNELMQEEKK